MSRTAEKTGPLASRLSGSSEMIQVEWVPVPYDFIVMLHSTHGTVLYHFQDMTRYLPKIGSFPHLPPT